MGAVMRSLDVWALCKPGILRHGDPRLILGRSMPSPLILPIHGTSYEPRLVLGLLSPLLPHKSRSLGAAERGGFHATEASAGDI